MYYAQRNLSKTVRLLLTTGQENVKRCCDSISFTVPIPQPTPTRTIMILWSLEQLNMDS